MRTFRKLLPLAAGIAFFLAVNLLLGYLMIPYQFTRMKIHRIETEDFQDLILGSSHGCAAMDPDVITLKTGRSCFNAAAGGQYPLDNYYLLRDACREHKPERVIFEYDPAYWIAVDPYNRNARYQLDVMENSGVKAGYFLDQFFSNDLRCVLMPWFEYRRDYDRIGENVAVKRSEAYRTFSSEPFDTEYQTCMENGFTAISEDIVRSEAIPELAFTPENEGYVQKNEKAFLRLVDLCEEQGIELVVVQTPLPPSTADACRAFFEEGSRKMTALAQSRGFTFLNFVPDASDASDAPGVSDVSNPSDAPAEDALWTDDDFSDGEGHMRAGSARRFSAMLGEKL